MCVCVRARVRDTYVKKEEKSKSQKSQIDEANMPKPFLIAALADHVLLVS